MNEAYEEVGGLIAQLLVNPATPPARPATGCGGRRFVRPS